MKKTTLSIIAITFATAVIFTGCSERPKKNERVIKIEKAEANITEGSITLDKAQEDYTADIEKYRKETDEKIAANKKSMADFEARISTQKKEAKAAYKKKIAELEQKNTDMKKKMDAFKAEGKEKWELFKADFDKGMGDIEQSLKDLTTK